MRFLSLAPALLLASGLIVAPAQAGPVFASSGGAVRADPLQVEVGYRQELAQLRVATMRQTQADGGTLTAAHTATLQRRLDRINDFHRRSRINNNPLAVGADGSAVDPKQLPLDWTNSRLIRVGANN